MLEELGSQVPKTGYNIKAHPAEHSPREKARASFGSCSPDVRSLYNLRYLPTRPVGTYLQGAFLDTGRLRDTLPHTTHIGGRGIEYGVVDAAVDSGDQSDGTYLAEYISSARSCHEHISSLEG